MLPTSGRIQLSTNDYPISGESIADYQYPLPPDRIAQTPLADRAASRLLVLDRQADEVQHRGFSDLCDYLRSDDVLVVNDTRVTAMRLYIEPGAAISFDPAAAGESDAPSPRSGVVGRRIEVFLLGRSVPEGGSEAGLLWNALVRPGKKMLPGTRIDAGGLIVTVIDRTDDRGGRLLRIEASPGADVDALLAERSVAPLPPYIGTELRGAAGDRYQTVYAAHGGSAAAPTAGLHFTPMLLERIAGMGVGIARVTLHVGLGTFRPIEAQVIAEHTMHAERYAISAEAAETINSARGRIIAVGTTSTRTLEAACVGRRQVAAGEGETSLYITPGYRFRMVDALVTNFHMPRSTLLVLVSAFAGRQRVLNAYREALEQGYRFLSFGDAMLIL